MPEIKLSQTDYKGVAMRAARKSVLGCRASLRRLCVFKDAIIYNVLVKHFHLVRGDFGRKNPRVESRAQDQSIE